MKVKLKRAGIGSVVAVLSALVLTVGLCYGTWVTHSISSNWDEITEFQASPAGAHYLQIKAPSGGRIYASVETPLGGGTETEIIADAQTENGFCKRKGMTLQSGTWYALYTRVENYSSGTGQSWVAEQTNAQLPTCTGS